MHELYQKWLDDGCPKVYCKCPCHAEIIIKKYHKYYGIPKYINGHQSIWNKGKINCYPDLITLCVKHNSMANHNRDYWEKFYMRILEKRNLLNYFGDLK
jgi:hypothetical protein